MNITKACLDVAKQKAKGLSDKETAEKLRISPIATRRRAGRVLWDTESKNMTQAIYKLTKAGLLIITITTSLSTTTDNRLNNRRRAPSRPTISYRVDSVASAPA
jgi:hypothetical protein